MLLPPTRAKGWVNARPQDMANLGARTAMYVAKLGARLATDMTTLKVLLCSHKHYLPSELGTRQDCRDNVTRS